MSDVLDCGKSDDMLKGRGAPAEVWLCVIALVVLLKRCVVSAAREICRSGRVAPEIMSVVVGLWPSHESLGKRSGVAVLARRASPNRLR